MRFGSFADWKKWAREGRVGWLALLLLLSGAAWLYLASPTERTVRLTGFVYEMIGIIVVFVEIAKASTKNKLIPIHRRLAGYLRRAPILRREKRVVIGTATGAASALGMRARATISLAPGSPLERRVDLLEKKVQSLDDRVEVVDARVEAEEKARAAAVAGEQAARERVVTELDGRIRDVEVGGLDLSLFGVFFLAVGLVLTTGTQEVCWLLGCRNY
jgi:hypothetical protein